MTPAPPPVQGTSLAPTAKVATVGGVGLAVTTLLECAQFYHWFTPPPAVAVAGIVTILSTLGGYLVRETRSIKP